jgi:hypothetical protein
MFNDMKERTEIERLVGIVAAVSCFSPIVRMIREVAGHEGVPYDSAAAAEIGIDQVQVYEGLWEPTYRLRIPGSAWPRPD